MGGELAQEQEWSEERSLDWHLLDDPDHAGVRALVRDMNAAYAPAGAVGDRLLAGRVRAGSSRTRRTRTSSRSCGGRATAEPLVCVANLSPVVREGWRVGLPAGGSWREVLNTDSRFYGGSDVGNGLGVEAEAGALERAAVLR